MLDTNSIMCVTIGLINYLFKQNTSFHQTASSSHIFIIISLKLKEVRTEFCKKNAKYKLCKINAQELQTYYMALKLQKEVTTFLWNLVWKTWFEISSQFYK